ncbi:MAG: hypothetical protein HKN43_04315 [Rhodothermales bacterium]|nr:hypothetical protein [Rhodothermales bacterium]
MHIDWDTFDVNELPPQFQEIAVDVGVEIVRYLIENWGGSVMYVPTLSKLAAQTLRKRIRSEYTGSNERELARKYNLSRMKIRQVLR